MDSQAISLVRSSFKAIAAVPDGPQTLSRSFYALLFARYPDARDFFPAAMDVQRDRLISAVQYVIERLEEESGRSSPTSPSSAATTVSTESRTRTTSPSATP